MTDWLAKAREKSPSVPKYTPMTKTTKTDKTPLRVVEGGGEAPNNEFLAGFGNFDTGMGFDTAPVRERWNERVAIAEIEGGLSRIEAELLAWDDVKTCVVCLCETRGESDAVRVSGGGWLHTGDCYTRYFGFRKGKQ